MTSFGRQRSRSSMKTTMAAFVADLVEPARVQTFEQLGGGRRAFTLAVRWLRPKLSVLLPAIEHEPAVIMYPRAAVGGVSASARRSMRQLPGCPVSLVTCDETNQQELPKPRHRLSSTSRGPCATVRCDAAQTRLVRITL